MIKWLLATPPEIGSNWGFYDEVHNPFIGPSVTVTDVKRGYVKYRWFWDQSEKYAENLSLSVRGFRAIYRKILNEEVSDQNLSRRQEGGTPSPMASR